VVLAGEPADVADLSQQFGGQHWADPEQLQQAGLGLGDGGLDARLHCGDPPVQAAHVANQLSSKLPAGDRRCAGRSELGKQRSGALGGEVAAGAGGNQVDQQPVQPVDGLGPHADQVLAPLGQQVQHHRQVLDAEPHGLPLRQWRTLAMAML
jgi:hypothetical protein